ncbi:MAG TPA: hypothetical protein VMD59_04335 [Acidimicrobiales bacterium]|nr:hypothetical protein [Acidimicrobiales bacterium]
MERAVVVLSSCVAERDLWGGIAFGVAAGLFVAALQELADRFARREEE